MLSTRMVRALLKALVKDTEGFMSRHVERPISIGISKRLMNTPVTPNQMTVVSMLIGIAGGLCFTVPEPTWHVVGALLFLLHSILDGCDGELARLKLAESRFGGVLDFWSDNVVHSAVFAGIGVGWWRAGGGDLAILCATAAVAATIVCATLIYRHTMAPKSGDGPMYESVSTSEAPSAMAKIADALSRRDFIYLVVLLAALGKVHWFLVLSAIGTPIYAILLLVIQARDAQAG